MSLLTFRACRSRHSHDLATAMPAPNVASTRPAWLGLSMIAVTLFSWIVPVVVQGELVEGFAEPYRRIEMAAASETGLITSIAVREGQAVKRGELLATLDVDVLVATLNIAKERSRLTGRYDGANAELEMRLRRLGKLQQLLREGHATEGEVERAQTDVIIAKSNVLLADEERRLAALECKRIEAQIQRRQVRCPIDGVVTEIRREVGEAVAINDPHLLTVVQLNPLRVKFSLTMEQAADLHEGQLLPMHLSEVSHAADATVEVVSPVLDAKSGTVQVTCVIDNKDNRYRSGMRCVVRLSSGAPQPDESSSSTKRFPH